jgi:hypothetical protein
MKGRPQDVGIQPVDPPAHTLDTVADGLQRLQAIDFSQGACKAALKTINANLIHAISPKRRQAPILILRR